MARKEVTKTTTKAVEVEAVEVEEVQAGGMNLDDGIVLTTFLLLAIAIALIILAGQIYPSGA
jgi:hypothetical protein